MAKIYTVRSYHSSSMIAPERSHDYTGTLDELIKNFFGYTLEYGHSRNRKIPLHPKTAAALVKALNDSASARHRYFDRYELIG